MCKRVLGVLPVGWLSESPPGDEAHPRLVTDGGESEDSADDDDDTTTEGDDDRADEDDGTSRKRPDGIDRANVEISDAGEADPTDPKWQKPDLEDIPEFEVRASDPMTTGETGIGDEAATPETTNAADENDPTAGMPNNARSPGATRISTEGTEAYVVALELCARLPEEVRLPEEAADLVPAAVEAELEEDIQQFAATEFGTQRPHVDTLSFDDVDGEIWLRLRIGLPTDDFDDLDPEAVRSYALEQLEGVL